MSYGRKLKSDEIYDLRANVPTSEVRSKVFNGFKKACHTLYKFDSNTERTLAIVLECDKQVQKWMRPSPKQFDIFYGRGGMRRYKPDFIVETDDAILMVETKSKRDTTSEEVRDKAKAAMAYCKAITECNEKNGGKPWEYAVISHLDVRLKSSFKYLMDNRVPPEQLELEMETG